MGSEKPIGADNQQGSRPEPPSGFDLTPQRLYAELLAAKARGLEAYLQGALKDATESYLHGTHRFGQNDIRWLEVLNQCLTLLGHTGWIYREGRTRRFWVLETTASFLSTSFDASILAGSPAGLAFARGYFDAEGGMPRKNDARLYFQFSQKDRSDLEILRRVLVTAGIDCGRLHNPSHRVDPDYWRFYVRARSHDRFMSLVGSWHPRKRKQIYNRMKI